MIKYVLFALLLAANGFAGQLSSYDQAVDALKEGKRIKYLIDWDLCYSNFPDVKPNFLSSYRPDNINIDKSGFLQSSGVRYTHEIKMIPGLGPVNQAYVYTFSKNNELHVINRFIDPVTFEEKMTAIEVTCELGKGFKVFS
ncbi:MAG: hypothetical protein EPN84_11975 [Legionella sp.]|nr:MAG: hypothetical protein EPN84_11975 [Legionella sp.]